MAHIPRIYWPSAFRSGDIIELDRERSHHLSRVLKRGPGDAVLLFQEPDIEAEARLLEGDKNQLRLEVLRLDKVERESPLNTVLVQAIARGDRMDFSIQKAVELGVNAVQPVISRRGGVQLDGKRLARKQEHWQAVAQSAAEQSGRTRIPPVLGCQKLDRWLSQERREGFVLAPSETQGLNDSTRPAGALYLLVGPEGGLDEAEIDLARRQGLQALSLGPRILRTETAGLVALSCLQQRWGDI